MIKRSNSKIWRHAVPVGRAVQVAPVAVGVVDPAVPLRAAKVANRLLSSSKIT